MKSQSSITNRCMGYIWGGTLCSRGVQAKNKFEQIPMIGRRSPKSSWVMVTWEPQPFYGQTYWQVDTIENITFPQTTNAGGNEVNQLDKWFRQINFERIRLQNYTAFLRQNIEAEKGPSFMEHDDLFPQQVPDPVLLSGFLLNKWKIASIFCCSCHNFIFHNISHQLSCRFLLW